MKLMVEIAKTTLKIDIETITLIFKVPHFGFARCGARVFGQGWRNEHCDNAWAMVRLSQSSISSVMVP